MKSFPIGIDVSGFEQVAARSRSNRIVSQTIVGLGSRKLIIGVDRLDYSKGIPEKMEAYERFLVNNPDQRGRVTFLQIAPTSRSEASGDTAPREPITGHWLVISASRKLLGRSPAPAAARAPRAATPPPRRRAA